MHPEIWEAVRKEFGDAAEFDIDEAIQAAWSKSRDAVASDANQGRHLLECAIEESNVDFDDLVVNVQADIPSRIIDAALVSSVIAGKKQDLEVMVTLADKLNVDVSKLSPELFGLSTALHIQTIAASDDKLAPSEHHLSLDHQGSVHELNDFLELGESLALVNSWSKGPDEFAKCLASDYPDSSNFKPVLVRMLAALVLTKDSTVMEELEEIIQDRADNPIETMNAIYLRGRARWYRNQIEAAVQDLQDAARLAAELFQQIREAQCLYYLARIKSKNPNDVAQEKEELFDGASQLARKAGRIDIEILANRARIIDLRIKKNYEESAAAARQLLRRAAIVEPGEIDHIVAHLRNDLGIALRNLKREKDRAEAETQYDANIAELGTAAVAGISRYLKADLYIDRMIESWTNALACADQQRVGELLDQAEHARNIAIEICLDSQSILEATGDWPAFRKAAGRLTTLRGQNIKLPADVTDVAEDASARNDQIATILLGGFVPSGDDHKLTAVSLDSDERLEELLNHYFGGLVVEGGNAFEDIHIHARDFLDDSTLLAIPIVVGNALIVRAFCRDMPDGTPTEIGSFAINGYGETTRKTLELLGQFGDKARRSQSPVFSQQLQNQVATADPILLSEREQKSEIKDVVVLPPLNSRDWPCPVEWFATNNDQGDQALSLLEFAQGSLVFASTTKPLASTEVLLANSKPMLLATSQSSPTNETIHAAVSAATGRNFNVINVETHSQRLKMDCDLIIIVGHDDDEHRLVELIKSWDWSAAKAVALLFCSSGQYQTSYGPYVESVGQKIRRSMRDDGVVVGARLPVMMEEASRFANFLLDRRNEGRFITAVVTEYLQDAKRFGGTGLLHPWVALS